MQLPDVTATPLTAGQSGYSSFRSPCLVWTRTGVLIAIGEAHYSGRHGSDIVCTRSVNGGRDWSHLTVITSHAHGSATSPTACLDPDSNDVVLLSCQEEGISSANRVWVQRSQNDGRSFTDPHEITQQVSEQGWIRYTTGPGNAVSIRNGPYRGRIVVPCSHVSSRRDTSVGHGVISDDGGHTWRLGYVCEPPDNAEEGEATGCQLDRDTLYFTCQWTLKSEPHHTRADAYSTDGGESLTTPYRPQGTLRTPRVHGDVLRLTTGHLVYAGCSHPQGLSALGLWTSRTEGCTWVLRHQISGLPAGCVAMVEMSPVLLGVLYETGDYTPCERIEFRAVPVRDMVRTLGDT